MKKNLTNFAALALIALAANFEASAQNDLGAACGCPAVNLRTTEISLSSLAVVGGPNDGDLIATNTILTCDKIYLLDNKIYVPAGKTLTIMPGTVIKGTPTGTTLAANAILVQRGGKIIADGTASCPIVFTAQADPMDGTYAMSNKGKWGGVVLLGKAKNNLTTASNYSSAGTIGWQGTATNVVDPTQGGDGIGFVEGFLAADARNLYGMPPGQEDDNDNSGIIRYVSIRHAGATVGANNELNGLTCASVGRGTTLDHIEVIANDDDGIEFFGGTVNIKYATMMFGNDDMFDYDLGWRGKAQFIFGIQLDNATITGGDNGFEADNDDQKSNSSYGSKCQIYNATFIGNAFTGTATGGGSGPAAIKAKERTEGEIYSSIFANFKGGLDLIKALGTRTGAIESYHNWTGVDNNGTAIPGGATLKVGCNTFVNCVNPISIANSTAALIAADNTKFTTDGNTAVASLPGFDYSFAASGVTVSNKYDATPNPNVASTCTPPVNDGFFTPTNYRGAFDANAASWLSDWAYAKLISATSGLVACPTDINRSGTTDIDDFLDLVGQFNQSCN